MATAEYTMTAEKINEIAALLNGTVVDSDYHRSAAFVLIDGASDHTQGPAFYLHAFEYTGKLNIRPVWPRDERQGTITPRQFLPYDERDTWTESINISASKSSQQIARDIERRLLPEYRQLHAQAVAHIQKYESHREGKREARNRIARALPGSETGPVWANADHKDGAVRYNGGAFTVNVEVGNAEYVYKIEIHSLSVDQAEQVMQLLATFK